MYGGQGNSNLPCVNWLFALELDIVQRSLQDFMKLKGIHKYLCEF